MAKTKMGAEARYWKEQCQAALKQLDKLTAEFERYKKASICWSVEDFFTRAKETGYTITKKKAQEALEDMMAHHDANNGICWITLDYYIEEYGTPRQRRRR